jgi:hypothetical protein
VDRASRIWLSVALLLFGLGLSFYSIRFGLIAHDIVVPVKGGGNFRAQGEDAALAGWIYLAIGGVAAIAGVSAWFGGLDDLVD